MASQSLDLALYPISRRGRNGWSSSLHGWFSPEGETAFNFMADLQNYERVQWVQLPQSELLMDGGAYIGSYSIDAKAVGSAAHDSRTRSE